MNTSIATRPPFSRVLQGLGVLLTCTLGLAAFSENVLGQPNKQHEEQWYQVEMIIFSQGGRPQAGDEVWRTDIDLDYPSNWLELLSPAQLTVEAGATNASSGLAEGRGDVKPSPNTGAGEIIDPSQTVSERALLLLPGEELTLTDQARRLSRNQQHRVLFHAAWRQPMQEDRQEPSILISGGELFEHHHELEGSINLYRRTYLHIETDLWLSQFATNFGQERRPWPKLPWPPNRPPEPDSMMRIDDGGTGLWHQFNRDSSKEYEAILAQPYVVENIVVMQQERRMRSSELHYIDHPKLGLLVKLTPYERAEENLDNGGQPAAGANQQR